MSEREGLAAAVERLTGDGYAGSFRAEERGLRETTSGRLFDPDQLVFEELLRFEGETDPDDQAAVLALRSRDGSICGTYVVAYGPGMDPLDAQALHGLRDGRGSRSRGPRSDDAARLR